MHDSPLFDAPEVAFARRKSPSLNVAVRHQHGSSKLPQCAGTHEFGPPHSEQASLSKGTVASPDVAVPMGATFMPSAYVQVGSEHGSQSAARWRRNPAKDWHRRRDLHFVQHGCPSRLLLPGGQHCEQLLLQSGEVERAAVVTHRSGSPKVDSICIGGAGGVLEASAVRSRDRPCPESTAGRAYAATRRQTGATPTLVRMPAEKAS